MDEKKKPPQELTSEEAIRELFPREVIEEMKRLTETPPPQQSHPAKHDPS